jgi:predicted GTPase
MANDLIPFGQELDEAIETSGLDSEQRTSIKKKLDEIIRYTPKVGIFGDTGVGKSSLCNALFGKEIAKISDVEACTREAQEIFLRGQSGKGGIVLLDMPGIGEDPEHHKEYMALYEKHLPDLDLLLWAFKADDRKYESSLDAYKKLFPTGKGKKPVIFAITQAEKIDPFREWNMEQHQPGDRQKDSLDRRAADIAKRFGFDTTADIIAISAEESYQLVELMDKIIEVLPKEKKFSFAREAQPSILSEESKVAAKRGILDSIKETVSNVWESYGDTLKETVSDVWESYGDTFKKIAETAVMLWLKKKLK